MFRILSATFLALPACAPSSQQAVMPGASAASNIAIPASGEARQVNENLPTQQKTAPRRPDSPAAAQGRRILSTAFVRIGPGGHLTVDTNDGRVLVLREVVMRPEDYCGVQISGGPAGAKYCGGYAEVAAARPGNAPMPAPPEPARAEPNQSR